MKIDISDKYKPLFQTNKEIDTYIITGGRFSSKSYSVALASVLMAYQRRHRILFGRYTNISGKDSTFPEVSEKIDLLGLSSYFDIQTNRIDCYNDSKIVFKGFKASSNNQTANLKSLKDFSCLIVEESEEIPDYDTYEKVSLSIRGNSNEDEEPNIKILILNPTSKEHWIFKHFFTDRGVKEGFNGVKDNVCYIHTNYLDCIKYVPNDIINSFELMKKNNPKRYKNVVLGGWLDKAEGVVFDNWNVGDFPEDLPIIYGMDFGYVNDPTTLVAVATDKNNIYIKGLLYKKEMSTNQIINFLSKTVKSTDLIIGDSAEPRLISEIRQGGFNIKRCQKGKDSIKNGLAKMQEKKIIIVEDTNLTVELNNYVWNDKKSNIPIDDYNHYIDAIRYAYQRHNKNKIFVI